MGQHIAIRNKLSGAIVVSAMSVGALAAAGLGSVPTASATCASFFGIGSSAECSSNFTTIAIAIGTNATAHADGLFGGAFVIGTDTIAIFNSAGVLGIALGLGTNSITQAGSGFADIAVNLTTASPAHTAVSAFGTANIAVNLFGGANEVLHHVVGARGIGNVAVNLFGSDNQLLAGTSDSAFGNTAFNAFGDDNRVTAASPFALAGAFGQQGATITKTGPGFNLGLQVGAAASTRSPTKATTNTALANTSIETVPRAVVTDGEPTTAKTGRIGHSRKAAARSTSDRAGNAVKPSVR